MNKIPDATMLTWWIQADIHFNDEDYFQQNLQLTLQAIIMDMKESIVNLNMHEEISKDVSAIITGQIGTWLSCGMVKTAVFTTGKGDIIFRMLCSTTARTFLLAEEASKILKRRLEYGIFVQFGLCLSSKLVNVSLLATVEANGQIPTLKPVAGKELVLLITTEENTLQKDRLLEEYEKEYYQFEDYTTQEVDAMMDTSTESGILSPDVSFSDNDLSLF